MPLSDPPIEDSFPSIPPFPINVPTAPLHRLSLSKLSAGDERESERLFSASKSLGFFYLDLRGDKKGEELLSEADQLFSIGEELFDLGREELEKYDYSNLGSYFGYKGCGTAYVDEKGGLDRNEFYNVPKDTLLSTPTHTPFAHPPLLTETHAPLLRSYIHNAHALVSLILTHLNAHLDLPPGTLQSLHGQNLISGDHVRFIKAPPQPEDDLRTAMGQHTDFGSVTILFNRVGGLQVLPPAPAGSSEMHEWLYVRPLPGHCIVNLGDAMVAFTNGLLRSNLHRVVAPPGEQVRCTRYALVYFARPGDEVPLKRIGLGSSGVIPALGDGVVEEGLPSREHIRRMALGKRVGVKELDVPSYLPGDGKMGDEGREGVVVG